MEPFLAPIEALYKTLKFKHQQAREAFKRPLTLAEKVLVSHMKEPVDENGQPLKRKISYANFYPDRVAMQDATAQMAVLQFINAKKDTTAVPTTIHCDHLILAKVGAQKDLQSSLTENSEVYEFLHTASKRYQIGFWKPGAGIIHQVVLENYAFPGGMMIGTDSHTPNAGGLGMVAIGVGGADAVDVMTGLPFNLLWPGVIGVKLTGKLQGWASPKDVILKLMGILTVKGGTSSIVEFFGEGCESISATGKGTICNMGAEHGATTSLFPYDNSMKAYLKATHRADWADQADAYFECFRADPEIYQNPAAFYDRVIHIDLTTLEPHIVGPHTPDLARPIGQIKAAIQKEGYPNQLKATLIGSCTNSSYEDIDRSASIAKWANENGIKAKVPFYITPGSESIYKTIQKNGQMEVLSQMGGLVLANACGPCIGQWHRNDVKKGETNSILSSYNRNFPGRNDGSSATLSFLASPEIVTAVALSGELSFNPLTDPLQNSKGEWVHIPPPQGQALPKDGLLEDETGFVPPALASGHEVIKINPQSDRLALLEPFLPWDKKDFMGLPILLKAKGKCTTDHISQAGVWLKYRGHLDKIADNTYLGAINAFTGEAGKGLDSLAPEKGAQSFPQIARNYKNQRQSFVVIGDENFGEGSSREHAAMQPRYLGCKAIIARSFARIHETNLKKHGILPLTFSNPKDYELILADDCVDIIGLSGLAPQEPVQVILQHKNGKKEAITCHHSLSEEQISWFKAGSALNAVAIQ